MQYIGLEYDEAIYEQGDAPDFSKEEWLKDKEKLDLPFPNLPYLIDGETKVTEAIAIMKYIANKYSPELLGRDAKEIAYVEMVGNSVSELKAAVTMPCYMHSDKNAITNDIMKKIVPLVKYLGNKDFLCGDKVTYPDFIFFESCDLMDFITDGQLYERFPVLSDYFERMKSQPGLAEYFEDDDKCIKRPFHNKIAKINN